jgi:hypothetical protein
VSRRFMAQPYPCDIILSRYAENCTDHTVAHCDTLAVWCDCVHITESNCAFETCMLSPTKDTYKELHRVRPSSVNCSYREISVVCRRQTTENEEAQYWIGPGPMHPSVLTFLSLCCLGFSVRSTCTRSRYCVKQLVWSLHDWTRGWEPSAATSMRQISNTQIVQLRCSSCNIPRIFRFMFT